MGAGSFTLAFRVFAPNNNDDDNMGSFFLSRQTNILPDMGSTTGFRSTWKIIKLVGRSAN